MIQQDLWDYIQSAVLPQYDALDPAHSRKHAEHVIKSSLALARLYGADEAMAYVSAAYHDLGLACGRVAHHLHSARILLADRMLERWFSPAQLQTMARAAQDHRASNPHPPESLYGRILADADRQLDYQVILTRTVQYGLTHYPEMDYDQHLKRAADHIGAKYGPNGYLRLWLDQGPGQEALAEVRMRVADHKGFSNDFRKVYHQQGKK